MAKDGEVRRDVPSRGPTVVHIGAFDLASYGDQLYPLVSAHELARRLDGVEVLPFGPVGTSGANLTESGPCWALGPWSAERAAEIARRADLILCGGGEIVQGDGTAYASFYGLDSLDSEHLKMDRWYLECLGSAEEDCPVVWHSPGVPSELPAATAERLRQALRARAVVTVRDERSRQLLEAATVDRPVEVVPDSALLLPRVLDSTRLDEERDRLRADGWYPGPATDGQVLVVQGNRTMTPLVEELAPALDALPPEVRVVTVSVSPCHNDDAFAAVLRQHLSRETWDVPASTPVEGLAAAITGADCFLGVSLHGAITALAYGRPTVTLDPFDQAKLASFLDLVGVPERRTADPAAAVSLAHDLAHRRSRGDLPAELPRLGELQERIDAHFDRVAELACARAEARRAPLEPFRWSDTGNAQHLALRCRPRDVAPLPRTPPPALRPPDRDPAPGELVAAVETAAHAQQGRRLADETAARERDELRRQNADLRGAIAHLEGLTTQLQDQLDRREPHPVAGWRSPFTRLAALVVSTLRR